jgi:DNA-binding response OmpR family regulator
VPLRRKQEVWDGSERRAPSKVLVVADDPGACELLVRILNRAGFRAEGVHTSDEAVAAAHEDMPRCVVLSLAAGGIGSNLKVLDTLRSNDDRRISSARALIVADNPRNRAFSFQSGTDAFLIRPFTADELVSHVDDVLRRPDDERARHRRDELVRHGELVDGTEAPEALG